MKQEEEKGFWGNIFFNVFRLINFLRQNFFNLNFHFLYFNETSCFE